MNPVMEKSSFFFFFKSVDALTSDHQKWKNSINNCDVQKVWNILLSFWMIWFQLIFFREDESILVEEHLTTVGFIFKTVTICPYHRYVKFNTDFMLIQSHWLFTSEQAPKLCFVCKQFSNTVVRSSTQQRRLIHQNNFSRIQKSYCAEFWYRLYTNSLQTTKLSSFSWKFNVLRELCA